MYKSFLIQIESIMICFEINKICLSFSFGFFFVIAFTSLENDILVVYSLLFCILHELAHLFVMRKFRVEISSIHFYGAGIKISSKGVDLLSKSKQLLVYSAGCTLNLVFALAYFFIGAQELFAINISLAFLNILPISYLDGGKILGALFPKNETILKLISRLFSALSVLCFFATAFFVDISSLTSSLITAFIILISLILG